MKNLMLVCAITTVLTMSACGGGTSIAPSGAGGSGAAGAAGTGGPGSGGGSGTCANTAACGGDLVGTWRITSSCVSESASMFSASCPSSISTGANLMYAGTIAYNADLTYTVNATISGPVTVVLPGPCLMNPGHTTTCAEATQNLMAQGGGFMSATCKASSGGGCACTVALNNVPTTDTGTYTTTAAGLLTETPTSGGTPSEIDYCVKGTTHTESPRAGSTMMGESVSGTLTFMKE